MTTTSATYDDLGKLEDDTAYDLSAATDDPRPAEDEVCEPYITARFQPWATPPDTPPPPPPTTLFTVAFMTSVPDNGNTPRRPQTWERAFMAATQSSPMVTCDGKMLDRAAYRRDPRHCSD